MNADDRISKASATVVESLESRTLFNSVVVTNDASDVSTSDAQLQAYVMENEGGVTQHVFKDGKVPTVGVGFNLKGHGARALIESLGLDYKQLLREAKTPESEPSVSVEQATQLFQANLATAIEGAQRAVSGFGDLSHGQQVALVDVAFAVGFSRLKSAKPTIKALAAGDLAAAATGLAESKYLKRELAAGRLADDAALLLHPVNVTTPPPTTDPTPTPDPDPTPVPPVSGSDLAITPADASSNAVRVGAGRVTLPSGATVDVAGGVLNIDNPEVSVGHSWEGSAPGNYAGQPTSQRWPDNAVNLKPTLDTLSLGGIYRAVIPGSIKVTDAAGDVKTRDVDYKVNEDWGQVLNLNNGLGALNTGMLTISYDIVKQRLDLIQVMPDGTLSVKKGTSAYVCPTLPEPDAGAAALAGVYVFTLDGAKSSGFTIQQRDILPIKPAAPVEPINPSAIPNTLAKLRAGGNVNIAFFGDSITEGAEAGKWWQDRSKTYTGLVTAGLQARFPQATVTSVLASQGGKGATDSQGVFQSLVLDPHNAGNKVDLVVINMGMNDKSIAPFKPAMNDYIAKARAAGIEVLLVTPMQSNIYYEPNQTDRVTRLAISNAIKEVAGEQNATCIDVNTEWNNQATHGVLPFSQLHNSFNHPGVAGMKLYADAIMRAFPAT